MKERRWGLGRWRSLQSLELDLALGSSCRADSRAAQLQELLHGAMKDSTLSKCETNTSFFIVLGVLSRGLLSLYLHRSDLREPWPAATKLEVWQLRFLWIRVVEVRSRKSRQIWVLSGTKFQKTISSLSLAFQSCMHSLAHGLLPTSLNSFMFASPLYKAPSDYTVGSWITPI